MLKHIKQSCSEGLHGRFAKMTLCHFKQFSQFCFVVLMSIGLSGCGLFEPRPQPPVYLKEVNFTLDQDANSNSAVPVDLLIIYDPDLLKVLLELEAKDYYSIASQLKQDYPELADVLHWELTPGQVIKKYPIKLRPKPAHGALIFANYYAPGPHRIRIGKSKSINVHFKAMDFCVVEQGCFGAPMAGADNISAQSAAMKSAFQFATIKTTDPAAAIASVNAAKTAKQAESALKQSKQFVKNMSTFKVK